MTVTSFTPVQTQILQNCHIHAYATGFDVAVLALILKALGECKTPVFEPLSDTGICIGNNTDTGIGIGVFLFPIITKSDTSHTQLNVSDFNSADLVCRSCVGAQR